MSENSGRIEAFEHQLLRAWASGDRKRLKAMLSRRFRLVVGAASPVLLDRKSLIDAAGERWTISSSRIGSAVYSREVDGVGIFATEVELQGRIDGTDVSGRWWMSDLWRKSTITRRWQLLDRQLARPDSDTSFSAAVRTLQLWR